MSPSSWITLKLAKRLVNGQVISVVTKKDIEQLDEGGIKHNVMLSIDYTIKTGKCATLGSSTVEP